MGQLALIKGFIMSFFYTAFGYGTYDRTLKMRLHLILARLFGKKIITKDESKLYSYELICYQYKGTTYVVGSNVYAKDCNKPKDHPNQAKLEF